MDKIKTLFKKELFFYLKSPVGFIAAFLFAVFANFLFMKDLFLRGNSSMRPFFDVAPWLLLIFVPAISMRIFSEEKKSNTIEVLLSLPAAESAFVVAKIMAIFSFLMITLALTFSIPATLSIISRVSILQAGVSYFGLILMASFFISVAIFYSSSTKNQVVAFLASILTLFFLVVIGGDFMASIVPGFILDYLAPLAPLYHYSVFLKGIIDIRSLFYFLSAASLFIFLTIINLEKRD